MLDLLISDASLHLFCRDQSKVTHNCLWETRPAAQQWCFSLMKALFFFCPPFSSVQQCWTTITLKNLGINTFFSFITNVNIFIHYCCPNSNVRNILLIQNSAYSTVKLSRNPHHITLNTVNKDPGISHPHSHPHPLPGRKGIGAK